MATQAEHIKHIPGFPVKITVDGFAFIKPSSSASERRLCILTHFHSDHTTGLLKGFQGQILCTQITADLVASLIGVDARCLHPLELRRTYDFGGLEVTALDAFHCPGAAIFLLRNTSTGYTVLHTGDFRAAVHLQQDELLLAQQIDTIYLDTTYCSPRYAFAEQSEVLAMVAEITKKELEEEPDTCFVIGTYQIGKEKVIKAVVEASGSKCFVNSTKERLLRLCQLWDDDIFTTSNEGVRVFVRSLMDTMPNGAPAVTIGDSDEPQFKRTCLFRPTGWTLKKDLAAQYKPWIEGQKRQYAVPYSEHSSFDELVAFVRAMKPRRIIPTVNAVSDQRTENMLKHFLPFMDLTNDKKRLDSYFSTPQPLKVARIEAELQSTLGVSSVMVVDERQDANMPHGQAQRIVEATEITATTEEVVDLEAVDLEEQKRIWEQIQIRVDSCVTAEAAIVDEQAGNCGSEPQNWIASPTAASSTLKRQSSLKMFFGDRSTSS